MTTQWCERKFFLTGLIYVWEVRDVYQFCGRLFIVEKFHRRVKKPKADLGPPFFTKKANKLHLLTLSGLLITWENIQFLILELEFLTFQMWIETLMKFNVSFQIILVLRTLDNYYDIEEYLKLFWNQTIFGTLLKKTFKLLIQKSEFLSEKLFYNSI